MNFKTFIIPVILLLSGFVLTIIGSLFKVMHWQGANEVYILGTGFKVVALILAIFKLISIYRAKN